MRRRFRAPAHRALALVAGLAWAQIGLVAAAVLIPQPLALAPRIARGPVYMVAEWTLLAPLSSAVRIASAAGPAVTAERPTLWAAALCALIATTACVSIASLLRVQRLRAVVGWTLLVAFAVSTVSAGMLASQLSDAAAAQRTFFALVSRTARPSADEASVSAAEAFVRRYPLSRWRSEALRIIAMHAEARGRFAEAQGAWSEFESCFDDPSAPGVAYAEYSRALCFEHLGRPEQAIAHHLAAVSVIRSRTDGIQSWIAPEAAKRIAALETSASMPVTASYWKTQSQTLQAVCSIE